MKKTILTVCFIVSVYILNAQVLYGTTTQGGKNNGGTICKLITATNTLSAAFSFDTVDGKSPFYTKLLQASDGKLYGMTSGGGNYSGVIFSYDPVTLTYKKLYDFDNTNGSSPYGSLIQATDGKLYGMTRYGGIGYGVIFSYDIATSTYTKLKNFDKANGSYPYGDLVQASDGRLYGMTSGGGSIDAGVIFSYDPAISTYAKLIDFAYKKGVNPQGSLIQASDGQLYGMTSGGGSSNMGVIFSYDLTTSTYTKRMDFDYTNGAVPFGSFIQASDGKLYGTTAAGGNNTLGVIFSYDPAASNYIKLKDFDSTDGFTEGSLFQASDGKLYGMTYGLGNDYGVIFSYAAATATYTKLRDFGANNLGNYVNGALTKDKANKLYGMTTDGGIYGKGTIFSYSVATAVFTKLKDFDDANGAHPYGSLTQASNGKLYGMTSRGGSYDAGVIFSC